MGVGEGLRLCGRSSDWPVGELGYRSRMTNDPTPLAQMIGESFLDHSGQRWWVKGRRESSSDQFVIEAEVSGSSYPRVDLYVMTEREFRARARAEQLKPDRTAKGREQHGR